MANEKRLISYDVLMKHLDECIKECNGLSRAVCVAIKCFVKRMPTVDAVEVVHSEWERFRHPSGTHGIRCKNCKEQNGMKKPYCPNCGAKMDGDGNGM